MNKKALALLAASALIPVIAVAADPVPQMPGHERMNERLDQRGETIEERFGEKAQRARTQGKEDKAGRMQEHGEMMQQRFDEHGDKIEQHRDEKSGSGGHDAKTKRQKRMNGDSGEHGKEKGKHKQERVKQHKQ
ncbi:MAG: hypothetical protein AB1469_06025 [Pseudomonadota bacterium]